jgi:hypothetical protein
VDRGLRTARGGHVTARRHRNYRRALDLIAAIDPLWLSSPDRARLEDRVEEMLLTTAEDPASIGRLRSDAAGSVREMVGAGMLPQAVADELTELMLAAGPTSTHSARRPTNFR